MERLNEFYKDILEVLGLEVDSNGGIFIKSGKARVPLTINGLPAVLPTAENIKNVIDTTGEKPKLRYFLFNPGYEDPIRTNTSLQKLREIMYRRIENKIAAIMETLIVIGIEEEDVKSTGMEEFIELTLRFKNKAVKKLFDEKVLEVMRELYKLSKKSVNPKLNLFHIFLKKGGKIGEERYNRIANAAFPVYEILINDFSVKKDTIEGIKLRNKDKGVIISAYEFIVKNNEELLNGITIGSKNKVAPGLHALLVILDIMTDKINKTVDEIKEDIDEGLCTDLRIKKLKISVNELDNFLNELKEDIEYVPSEKDLEALLKQGVGVTGVGYKEPIRTPVNNQPQVNQQTPDPVEMALMGNPNPTNSMGNIYNMQQPMPQPTMQMQPMMQNTGNIDPLDAALMRGF